MRKCIYTLLHCIAVFFIVTSQVHATTQWAIYKHDDFDDATAGTVPTNWVEKDAGYFDVSTAVSHGGAKSLRQKTLDAATSHLIYRSDTAGLTDMQAQATIRFTGASSAGGVTLRTDPSTGYSYMGYINNSTNFLQIYRVGATVTKLAEVAIPVNDNTWYGLSFQVVGSTLTATLYDGTFENQLATVSTTDTTYTSGYAGYRSFFTTASQNVYMDEYRVYTQAEVTATKLQVLLPGEISDPGATTGRAVITNMVYTGPNKATVNAVDNNWNIDVDASPTATLASSNAYTTLPAAFTLSSGTKQVTFNEATAGSGRTLTVTDGASILTSDTSSSYTVTGTYPYLTESFVDNGRLQNTNNISFNTNTGTKYNGNPVLVHGTVDSAIIGYNTIINISGTYYMWYSCHDGSIYRICYATSPDGITWTRPNLGVVSYLGNTNNNIVLQSSGEGTYGGGVWYDIDDPDPTKRYKMLYDEINTFTVRLATSSDGIHWTTSTTLPWPSSANREPRGILKVNGRWYAYAQNYVTDDREIALYTNDGAFTDQSWVYRGIVLSSSSVDDQKYGFSAWYKDGVFYGINERFSKTADISFLELWSSRDGISWTRNGTIIPNGTYDSGFMVKSNMFTEVGSNTWRLYYGGSQRLHANPPTSAPMDLDVSEWGANRVTNVELTNIGAQGTFETVAIPTAEISNKNLALNYSGTTGTARVEVLDINGDVISGFSQTMANTLSGSSTQGVVTWGGSPSLANFGQSSIKLKVYLTGDIHLYSYSFITALSDSTPPTVSVTAPSDGAHVSGSVVPLTASVSDDIGIVGVQFTLDGNSLGSEDTSDPFEITWDSTTVSDGVHTLSAIARDAAGNSTTSTGVTIAVVNSSESTSAVEVPNVPKYKTMGSYAPKTSQVYVWSTDTSGCKDGDSFSPQTGVQCPLRSVKPSPVSQLPVLTEILKWKSRGPMVKILQQFLNSHGFAIAPSGVGSLGQETEYFGLATKAAVQKFQKVHGLIPDGVVGRKTWSQFK